MVPRLPTDSDDAMLDTDRDGIPDELDKCPQEPETYNGFADEDGCPEPHSPPTARREKYEILDKIYFERNASVMTSITYPILESVAKRLRDHPEIMIVQVQGHACATESRVFQLAKKRAANVHQYLVQHGVEGHRLDVQSFGSLRSVAAYKNEATCANNRRVEFVVLQRRASG